MIPAIIAVDGSKLIADLGSGQEGSGRLPLSTCSSNRTGEIPPSGMIVGRGGNGLGSLMVPGAPRLSATRPVPKGEDMAHRRDRD